jgi:hypothetical protein
MRGSINSQAQTGKANHATGHSREPPADQARSSTTPVRPIMQSAWQGQERLPSKALAPPLHDSTLHCSITVPPLATEPLSIKLLATMGGYKGRVNVKHRKRRSAKAERIKTVAAKKPATKKDD